MLRWTKNCKNLAMYYLAVTGDFVDSHAEMAFYRFFLGTVQLNVSLTDFEWVNSAGILANR